MSHMEIHTSILDHMSGCLIAVASSIDENEEPLNHILRLNIEKGVSTNNVCRVCISHVRLDRI